MRRIILEPRFNGTAIAEKRRLCGMSQDDLGVAVNVTRYQIIRIEKGESASIERLAAICRVLDLPIQDVLMNSPVAAA